MDDPSPSLTANLPKRKPSPGQAGTGDADGGDQASFLQSKNPADTNTGGTGAVGTTSSGDFAHNANNPLGPSIYPAGAAPTGAAGAAPAEPLGAVDTSTSNLSTSVPNTIVVPGTAGDVDRSSLSSTTFVKGGPSITGGDGDRKSIAVPPTFAQQVASDKDDAVAAEQRFFSVLESGSADSALSSGRTSNGNYEDARARAEPEDDDEDAVFGEAGASAERVPLLSDGRPARKRAAADVVKDSDVEVPAPPPPEPGGPPRAGEATLPAPASATPAFGEAAPPAATAFFKYVEGLSQMQSLGMDMEGFEEADLDVYPEHKGQFALGPLGDVQTRYKGGFVNFVFSGSDTLAIQLRMAETLGSAVLQSLSFSKEEDEDPAKELEQRTKRLQKEIKKRARAEAAAQLSKAKLSFAGPGEQDPDEVNNLNVVLSSKANKLTSGPAIAEGEGEAAVPELDEIEEEVEDLVKVATELKADVDRLDIESAGDLNNKRNKRAQAEAGEGEAADAEIYSSGGFDVLAARSDEGSSARSARGTISSSDSSDEGAGGCCGMMCAFIIRVFGVAFAYLLCFLAVCLVQFVFCWYAYGVYAQVMFHEDDRYRARESEFHTVASFGVWVYLSSMLLVLAKALVADKYTVIDIDWLRQECRKARAAEEQLAREEDSRLRANGSHKKKKKNAGGSGWKRDLWIFLVYYDFNMKGLYLLEVAWYATILVIAVVATQLYYDSMDTPGRWYIMKQRPVDRFFPTVVPEPGRPVIQVGQSNLTWWLHLHAIAIMAVFVCVIIPIWTGIALKVRGTYKVKQLTEEELQRGLPGMTDLIEQIAAEEASARLSTQKLSTDELTVIMDHSERFQKVQTVQEAKDVVRHLVDSGESKDVFVGRFGQRGHDLAVSVLDKADVVEEKAEGLTTRFSQTFTTVQQSSATTTPPIGTSPKKA
ncbi:unnamed protein product [Amoebophrya sp. A120]|nr:unnamed protein product [Amoebophrya sp. A120]|eukprot:GSA120T00017565001.1